MWESPITIITENITRDITNKTDGTLVEYVHTVGFDVNKEELVKALAYDRNQYEKGYADGRVDRDAEIVRCKECKWYDISSPYGTVIPDAYHCKVNDRFYAGAHFCAYGERRE